MIFSARCYLTEVECFERSDDDCLWTDAAVMIKMIAKLLAILCLGLIDHTDRSD